MSNNYNGHCTILDLDALETIWYDEEAVEIISSIEEVMYEQNEDNNNSFYSDTRGRF